MERACGGGIISGVLLSAPRRVGPDPGASEAGRAANHPPAVAGPGGVSFPALDLRTPQRVITSADSHFSQSLKKPLVSRGRHPQMSVRGFCAGIPLPRRWGCTVPALLFQNALAVQRKHVRGRVGASSGVSAHPHPPQSQLSQLSLMGFGLLESEASPCGLLLGHGVVVGRSSKSRGSRTPPGCREGAKLGGGGGRGLQQTTGLWDPHSQRQVWPFLEKQQDWPSF